MVIRTGPNNKASFYVKYFSSDNRLFIQMFKHGWEFPQGGVSVPFTITFDSDITYPGDGRGRTEAETSLVEAPISDPTVAADFMNHLMHANKMTVTFKGGDEKPWVADMKGSREVGTAFMNAVKSLCAKTDNCGKATQPFDMDKPTQPYNKNDQGA
jgi:hypothetical protein